MKKKFIVVIVLFVIAITFQIQQNIDNKNEIVISDVSENLSDREILVIPELEIKSGYVYSKAENMKFIDVPKPEMKKVEVAKQEIVKESTKQYVATSRDSLNNQRSVTMTATAYDLSYESTGKNPGDKGYGITASGTQARHGAVAVDTKVIPLGTKLYIESLDGTEDYGYAIAEDTGGAIKGNKIDLFFSSHSEALQFGRRKVKVYIVD